MAGIFTVEQNPHRSSSDYLIPVDCIYIDCSFQNDLLY
jgi:hypothetical protein